jgi:hypothetical protein
MPLALPSPHTPCCLPASPDRIACPPFDSAERELIQPAAQQLRHLQGHEHGLHVLCALRSCPDPQPLSRVFSSRACHLRRHCPTLFRLPARTSPPIVRVPLPTLGRTQTPCRTRTSCSSVARGRAPRPLPQLVMARAGVREAAREMRSARVLLGLLERL